MGIASIVKAERHEDLLLADREMEKIRSLRTWLNDEGRCTVLKVLMLNGGLRWLVRNASLSLKVANSCAHIQNAT